MPAYIFPQQEQVAHQIRTALRVFAGSEAAIRPHFHLTGPSGSGKSYLLKSLSEEMGLPMIELNAAQLTAEGLSGNSLSKALRELRCHWNTPNIIFVDEFDKLFQRNGEHTEGFRSMVQDEFLSALESDTTQIFTDYGKYEPVKINNSLFVFAGAYSNQKIHTLKELREAGLRTEFVGRVPLVYSTSEIPLHELTKMVPKLELFRNYMKLAGGKEHGHVQAVIKLLQAQNKDLNIGIRLLNSCVHQHFMNQVK